VFAPVIRTDRLMAFSAEFKKGKKASVH